MNSLTSTTRKTKNSTKKIRSEILKKQKVYNLIILDESGSMESIKSEIISGFNEVIMSVKSLENKFPMQKHYVTFVTFNSMGITTSLDEKPVHMISAIDENSYRPNACTPLYDAIGNSLNALSSHLKNKKDSNVLVTILTDGLENASKEFSGNQIKEMIEKHKSNGWEFTYIGADHDIEKAASSISIENKIVFDRSESSINEMFLAEMQVRDAYCASIGEKK